MYKLFFSPGACSLSPHIALNELGLKYEIEKVDLSSKKSGGEDYMKINPRGYVPALETEKDGLLTEGAVILQYLCDQNPNTNLLPKQGTHDRYVAMQWLNFVATEIHKGFSPLWGADRWMGSGTEASEKLKEAIRGVLAKKMDYLAEHLKNNKYIMGNQYTVIDGYLFTVLNWSPMVRFDLAKWPALVSYMDSIKSRPAVQAAMKAEGLMGGTH